MKKIMIIGGGRGQIPIMNLCHDYGWYVIAVSPKGNYPGLNIADKVCWLDVKDKEAVLQAAKKEGIQAILTDQLDVGVQTVAFVSEQLGLPGITYDVALKFTNKYIMRQAAKKAGINVPYSVAVNNVDNALSLIEKNSELFFPLMIKPVDNDGSRGVYRVNSLKEIVEKFSISQQYSQKGEVIIERFIEGKEYVVEAFTREYETVNLAVGHRDYFQVPHTFIPNATVFRDAVSANSELEERLKQTNMAIVKAFGLKFGITHGEYMYNEEEDKIYLVEIAARGGGVFISSDLIPGATGVNANDLLVREALGISEKKSIDIHPGASAYFCYLTPQGEVTKLEGVDEVRDEVGLIKAYFDNISLGMVTSSITDKSSRKGPILVKGKTKQECYDTIERIKKKIIIEVTNNGMTKNIIWHEG